jgi:hypothetical protein
MSTLTLLKQNAKKRPFRRRAKPSFAARRERARTIDKFISLVKQQGSDRVIENRHLSLLVYGPDPPLPVDTVMATLVAVLT